MESVEVINKRLVEYYGTIWDGRPAWRIVWSDDQLEKRFGEYTDSVGDILIRTVKEVREVPKYWWKKGYYVLERLFEVPEHQRGELLTSTSYEPIWFFEDKNGNPLPPKWEAIQFAIKAIYDQLEHKGNVKYVDPDMKEETKIQDEIVRVEKMKEDLFGNETDISDHLAYGTGVTVPENYKEKN
jgi:hypothetical protein